MSNLDDLLKHIKNKPGSENKDTLPKSPSRKVEVIDEGNKITAQMQKKITDFLRSDKKAEPQKGKALFDKMTFVFIPYGTLLDKKRIDYLADKIRKNGGTTFLVNFFDWKPPSYVEVFIVVSKEMSFQGLLNSIPKHIYERIYDFLYIDPQWISECLKTHQVLNTKPFIVDWKKIREEEELKRIKQREKEEEARRQELSNKEPLLIEEEEAQDGKRTIFTINDDEPTKMINEEEKLEKSSGEEINEEKMGEQPRKKLRIRENEAVMKTFRNLYDYRFGIEEEAKHDMEIEQERKESPVKKVQTHNKEKKSYITEEEDEFENFLKEAKAQDKKEMEEIKQRKERESENSRDSAIDNLKNEEEAENKNLKELGVQPNYNKHLTDEFEKLLRAYINEKDKGRMHAYRKAIAAIRSVPFRIENADQVKNVAGIGQKIRDKIAEILKTGKLKKADEFVDEKQNALNILTKVWGVGVQTATSLYNRGISSIAELRKNQFLLNDNQKIGLKYFEEFEQRIPREDVATIIQIITVKVDELSGQSGLYDVICCGSYRRGKPTCGDIDVLLTRTDGKPFEGFLSKLVRGLKGVLITDDLTQAKMSPLGSETYMGVCVFDGIHRRIDIKIYPKDQFGYALLYFTGSDYFNRSVRLFALKKEWSLSDHGLSRVTKTEKGTKTTFENIPCYTEEEVFNVLGLKYRRPEERDV